MRKLILFLTNVALTVSTSLAQQAATKGECSPVVLGSNNVINCGRLSKKDAQLLADIFNQLLLSNQSLSDIKEKLSEVLDPNHPVVRYEVNGWSVTSRGGQAVSDPAESPKYGEMLTLQNEKSWAALLKLAEEENRTVPDWITPYYYAAVANTFLCNRKQALEDLTAVTKKGEGLLNFADLLDKAKSLRVLIGTGELPPDCKSWRD